MDIFHRDDETAATADFIAAQAVEIDDYFTFDIEKVGAPGEEVEGLAVRYRVRAELTGRRFEEVMVDIGFSDSLKWKPEPIRGQELLAFADIEPIEVPVLPLEQHIAEKVHAYTKTYGQGRRSSRAKDLVDLVLVKQLMVLDAARLRSALEGVFEGRRQHGLPDRFPPPPPEWAVPYRKWPTKLVSIRTCVRAMRKLRRCSIPFWPVEPRATGIRRGVRGRNLFSKFPHRPPSALEPEAAPHCRLLALKPALTVQFAAQSCPIHCAQFCALPLSKSVSFGGAPEDRVKCTKPLRHKGFSAIE